MKMKKTTLFILPALLLIASCAKTEITPSSISPLSSSMEASSAIISSEQVSSSSEAPISSSEAPLTSSSEAPLPSSSVDSRPTETITINFNSDEASICGVYNENGNKSSYVWAKGNFIIENSSIGEHKPHDYLSEGDYRFYVKSKLWFKTANYSEIKSIDVVTTASNAFNGNEECHNCTISVIDATHMRINPDAGRNKVDIYNQDTVNVKNSKQKRLISATLTYYVA